MVRRGRGYSWKQFEPGHTVTLKHGTSSERAIAERLPETRREVLDVAPWLEDATDQMAVQRFMRAETRARMLDAWIVATMNDKGIHAVKPWVWQEANRADRLAAELGHFLGLDPIGRVRLQHATAEAGKSTFDLAKHWQEQQEQTDGP